MDDASRLFLAEVQILNAARMENREQRLLAIEVAKRHIDIVRKNFPRKPIDEALRNKDFWIYGDFWKCDHKDTETIESPTGRPKAVTACTFCGKKVGETETWTAEAK